MSQTPPSNQEQTKQAQSDKPMRQLLEATDQAVARANRAEAELRTRELRNEPLPHFVDLSNRLYDAAIAAAKQQVARAENLLRQIEAEAELVRQNAKERWHEIQELERNLEDMSSEMLQSFGRYNGVRK